GRGLVREDVDPNLAAALDRAGHGASGGLDLPAGDPGRFLGRQAVLTEGDRVAALGHTGHPSAHDLAMLDSTGHQHRSDPRPDLGRDARARGARRGRDVAPVDPDLDPDAAVRRVGVDLAVADVRTQRAERDAAFLVPLPATHL